MEWYDYFTLAGCFGVIGFIVWGSINALRKEETKSTQTQKLSSYDKRIENK